jgi:hypothetical protein
MKTFSFVAIASIGIMFLLATTAAAQMHGSQDDKMPMNTEMMQGHMTSMANMMSEMAAAMQKGEMTPNQQTQCAAYMQRLSGMMLEMAADLKQEKIEQRQRDLQEIEKEWDYFKDQNRNLYGH